MIRLLDHGRRNTRGLLGPVVPLASARDYNLTAPVELAHASSVGTTDAGRASAVRSLEAKEASAYIEANPCAGGAGLASIKGWEIQA
jgi:hypothetical protein